MKLPFLFVMAPMLGSLLLGCALPGAQVKYPSEISQPIIFGNMPAISKTELPASAKKIGSFKGQSMDFFANNTSSDGVMTTTTTVNNSANDIYYQTHVAMGDAKNRCVTNFEVKVYTAYMPTALKSRIKVSGDVYELPEGAAK